MTGFGSASDSIEGSVPGRQPQEAKLPTFVASEPRGEPSERPGGGGSADRGPSRGSSGRRLFLTQGEEHQHPGDASDHVDDPGDDVGVYLIDCTLVLRLVHRDRRVKK